MAHKPFLALTFDDHFIDDWYDAIPVFGAHGARATFYAYGFPHVPAQAINKFYKLIGLGHEIGYHSFSHASATQIAQEKGVDEYIRAEILPGLEGMRMFGFNPSSFAYPMNARTPELDAALAPYFSSLRARADTFSEALQWDTAKPLIKARNCDLVRDNGVTIRSADDVVHELRTAAHEGRSLALTAHGINDGEKDYHRMTLRGLDYILWNARRLGFEFVTASEFRHAAQ